MNRIAQRAQPLAETVCHEWNQVGQNFRDGNSWGKWWKYASRWEQFCTFAWNCSSLWSEVSERCSNIASHPSRKGKSSTNPSLFLCSFFLFHFPPFSSLSLFAKYEHIFPFFNSIHSISSHWSCSLLSLLQLPSIYVTLSFVGQRGRGRTPGSRHRYIHISIILLKLLWSACFSSSTSPTRSIKVSSQAS